MKLMKNHKKINALLLTASIGFNSILGSNVPMAMASNTFSITKKVTIGVGESYKLNTSGSTEGITFKSSNKKIVSVTKKGKITGKKKGTTTIIAKVKKQKKSCKVTVKPAAKGIKIKNGNLTLYTESAEQLIISFTSGYSKSITYTSTNPSVASVSKKGLVLAKNEGTTTITATTFNGKRAKITCTVLDDQKSTMVPTVIPSATPIMTATAPAVTTTVSPTATTLVETPTVSPVATAPVETPTVSPTTTDPVETPSVSPVATAPVETPSVSPTATAPVETPTVSPVATTPVETPTVSPVATTPVETPTVTPNPYTTPVITPSLEPGVVTRTAIISKIKDGTIYIDNNSMRLQLTDCITYFNYYNGKQYEVTQNELFPGDKIMIAHNGNMQAMLAPPYNLYECEAIWVLESNYQFLPIDFKYDTASYEETKIETTYLGHKITLELNDATTIYNDPSEGHATYYHNIPWMAGLRIYFSPLYDANITNYTIDTMVFKDKEPTKPYPSAVPLKPVIYLYPEETTEISVDLDYKGEFSYVYPYTPDGHWDVIAKPDGTLTNLTDGLEYSYLFWEGTPDDFTPDFSKGFCVKGKDITSFFQKVLPEMGLTPKEYNEFIVYWAPLLQNNPYNLISFQAKNYEELAPLDIDPLPDSMLRVYMAVKPLETPIAIEAQTFEPFQREGFSVVEWGGGIY